MHSNFEHFWKTQLGLIKEKKKFTLHNEIVEQLFLIFLFRSNEWKLIYINNYFPVLINTSYDS